MRNEEKIKEDIKNTNILFFVLVHPLILIICNSIVAAIIDVQTDNDLWTSISIGTVIAIPLIYFMDIIRKKRINHIRDAYGADNKSINSYEKKKNIIVAIISIAVITGMISNFAIKSSSIKEDINSTNLNNNKNDNSQQKSETESTTTQVEDNESTTTCSICGREFTGSGYHEVSEGVWELCNEPYQCQICSRECGMKHTNNWEDIEQGIQNNSNTSERQDIISYIESHTFSYGGNGSVTFNDGVVTVNGGRATLSGDYSKISDNSIRYKLQAIYGNFDASNNRGSFGTFYLNPNGTLTQKISDGSTTKTYTLTPE